MSIAPAIKFVSIEDYLTAEEDALRKHEYYQGEVFAMAGASMNHNRIVRNALLLIGNHLNGESCEVFPSDIRIHIEANTLFTYSDLTIFCDEIETYKDRTDTALNPTVIIEVLFKKHSNTTGTKFSLYRDIPSLKEYIIISSIQVLVEKNTRQSDHEWLFMSYEKADDAFMIEPIKLSVEVSSLYRNVILKKSKRS